MWLKTLLHVFCLVGPFGDITRTVRPLLSLLPFLRDFAPPIPEPSHGVALLFAAELESRRGWTWPGLSWGSSGGPRPRRSGSGGYLVPRPPERHGVCSLGAFCPHGGGAERAGELLGSEVGGRADTRESLRS